MHYAAVCLSRLVCAVGAEREVDLVFLMVEERVRVPLRDTLASKARLLEGTAHLGAAKPAALWRRFTLLERQQSGEGDQARPP